MTHRWFESSSEYHLMFLEIPEYPEYSINTLGQVLSSKSGNILIHHTNSSGYLYVSLWIDGRNKNLLVHRLLARVFKDLPSLDSDLEVDHKDRNKTNIELNNLVVLTKEEHNLKTLKDLGYISKLDRCCEVCGVQISKNATLCREHSNPTKNPQITIEEIEYWVRNYSWVRAGKELGLSDNGLRKRYKSLSGKDPKNIKN